MSQRQMLSAFTILITVIVKTQDCFRVSPCPIPLLMTESHFRVMLWQLKPWFFVEELRTLLIQ